MVDEMSQHNQLLHQAFSVNCYWCLEQSCGEMTKNLLILNSFNLSYLELYRNGSNH